MDFKSISNKRLKMSNQYFKELSAGLDEIAKQENAGQCLDLAGLSQREIEGIHHMSTSDSLQELQAKYTVRHGEPSNSLADLIKAHDQQSFGVDPNVVEEKMEVAVDCLNSQQPNL